MVLFSWMPRLLKSAPEQKVCPPEIMAGERAWIIMLEAAVTIEATFELLVLKNGSGAVLAKLIRRDFD